MEQFPSYITGTLDEVPTYFSTPDNNLSVDVAARRAARYNYALGSESPGEEELFNEILSGQEDQQRAFRAQENAVSLNLRRAKLAEGYLHSLPPGAMTQEDLKHFQTLDKYTVDQAYEDPSLYYERKFAERAAVQKISDVAEDVEDPRDTVGLMAKSYNHLLVNQNTALKFLEEAQSLVEDRTWGQALKPWIPFWRWAKLSSNFEDEFIDLAPSLLGSNMRKQVEGMWQLPPMEFYRKGKEILAELKKSDPELALSFASALVGYSASTEFLDDITSFMDLTVLGFTPKAAIQSARGLTELSAAGIGRTVRGGADYVSNLRLLNAHGRLKHMVKNNARGSLSYVDLLPEYRRAHNIAIESLMAKAEASGQATDLRALFGTIQDIHNPQSILEGAQNISAEEAARIEIGLLRTSTNTINNLLMRPKLLHRLSEQEVALATAEAADFVERMYAKSTLGSRIVSIRSANIDAAETLTGNDAIKVYFGSKSSTGYASEGAAKGQAKKLGIEKFGTEEIDGKWYITVTQFVDETTPSLRAFSRPNYKFADKERSQFLAPIMSRTRMRESLIPEQLAEDILVTQSAINKYFHLNRQQFAEDFSRLNKKSKAKMDAFLERERDYRFQDGPPESVIRGRYASNIGEFQMRWQKDYGSLPQIEEIQTYFAWKNWNDVDYALRNIDLTRDKARLGVMAHTLRIRTPGNTSEWTPKLEGKILNEFPFDRPGNAGILIWDSSESHLMRHPESYKVPGVDYSQKKSPRGIFQKGFLSDEEKEYIQTLIERDGYRVLHLSPYSKQDLADYMGNLEPTGPEFTGIPDVPKADLTVTVKTELLEKARNNTLTPEERRIYLDQYAAETAKFDYLWHNSDEAVAKEFYAKLSLDKNFRELYRDVKDPVEQLNALADYHVKLEGETGESLTVKNLGKHQPFGKRIASLKLERAKTNAKVRLTKEDLNQLNKVKSKPQSKEVPAAIYTKDELRLLSSELKNHRELGSASIKEDTSEFRVSTRELDKDILDQYEVIPVKNDDELLRILSDKDVLSKQSTRSALGSRFRAHTPYYIISDRGTDVTHGLNIVLSGEGKQTKAFLQTVFPDSNIMTATQAKTWMKTGKEPLKSISQRAEEASKDALPPEGLNVGDTVYVLTPEDKKELAKTGKLDLPTGIQTQKITNVLTDPNRPDLGTWVQVEGSQTGFQATDLYIIKQAPISEGLPTPKFTKYTKKGLDVGRYDYILVHPEMDIKSESIGLINFPYTEGGHIVNEDSWHIRQPQIYTTTKQKSTIHTYEGDTNAYSSIIEKDARLVADRLEEMRNILKGDLENGTNHAERYYIDFLDGMSKDFKSFKKQFREFHPKGHLRLDKPFVVTPKDRGSYDAIKSLKNADGTPTYPNLQNHRDNPHNLYYNELNLQFALERSDSLDRVVRKGTAQHPVFGSESPTNLSPMSTLINSTSQLMRNRMLSDLKVKSAENFAKMYHHVIDAPLEAIQRDPMEFILNPRWIQGLKGNDLRLLNSAKDYRRALIDFMGVDEPFKDHVKVMQAAIAESLKSRLGQGSHEIIDKHLLRGRNISPYRFVNNMVYDLYFGLLNIKQLLVQSMTAFHTAAVLGPITGARAGMSAHIARWVLFDEAPERLAYLGEIASKSGLMRKEEFIEAVTAYRNSGFHIISQETAIQDDFINQSIKESFVDRSRDAARFFFKEGDRYARTTAYLGAYIEWRKANPKAIFDIRKQNEILARANTLSLNMTGASQSVMAKGIGKIPLKFSTYYLRVMEQLLPGWTGGPLTAKEKLRAYATYSMLFGVPITASGTFGLWPIHKEWSKYLIDNGIDTDENLILKAFNDGLAELLPQLVGVDQNFSEALGPSGSSWLYDIYNGRSTMFDVVTGPGGVKFYEFLSESWPMFTLMANAFRDDDEKYPLSMSDLEGFVRSSSSSNNIWRAIQMYNTGVYMSKNRTPLSSNVGALEATMSLLFGTIPKDVQKAFTMTDMTRATAEMKKEAKRDIIKFHRLQMKAIVEGDLDSVLEFGKKIKWMVNANGFTSTEFNKLFADVVSQNRDVITLAERKFYSSTPERQKMWMDSILNKEGNE